MDQNYLSAEQAKNFISAVFHGLNMPKVDADLAADMMVRSDLVGADGHGIFRLQQYAKRITENGINLHPQMKLLQDAPAIALLHGDNAIGHLVMHKATMLAIEKAKKVGIGWVGCSYSNHAGAASTYANLVAEAGLVGLYLAVGSANHMAPWGGIDMLLSTNPIAISVPTGSGNPPVTLDMATTVAAYGKVKMKAQQGEQMPPIGDYKGYGLSLMIALLAGCMNGAAVGSKLVDFNADSQAVTNTGQTVVAINPDFLGGTAHLIADTQRMVKELKPLEPCQELQKSVFLENPRLGQNQNA